MIVRKEQLMRAFWLGILVGITISFLVWLLFHPQFIIERCFYSGDLYRDNYLIAKCFKKVCQIDCSYIKILADKYD